MREVITTRRDLHNWVWERLADADAFEIERTVIAIENHPKRPEWGTDWEEFFSDDVLPENLCDLFS